MHGVIFAWQQNKVISSGEKERRFPIWTCTSINQYGPSLDNKLAYKNDEVKLK